MNTNPKTYTWTQADYIKGFCAQGQVGHIRNDSVWSLQDYMEGHCKISDVDEPKGVLEVVAEPVAQSTPRDAHAARSFLEKMQIIRIAVADRILNYPGGPDKWMEDNPATHAKLAIKGFAEPQAPNATTVTINVPWLTQERLSYKNVIDARPLLDNTLLDEVVQEVKPNAPEQNASWKEPPPSEGLAHILREDDK